MNGIKLQYLNGLGLVAKSKRVIKPLTKYYSLIPKPERTDPIVNRDGSVDVTVEWCDKIVKETIADTQKLAPLLKGSSIEKTCKNIFNFIYDHIQYEEDKPNVEQVRRPARTLWDSKGDCDCMSILAMSFLRNLNIPAKFRIVKMYGRSWFQHIYVIVPKPGKSDMSNRNNYIVIDPVLDNFNQEAPKINHKKDFNMGNLAGLAGLAGIPIQYLNGVDTSLKFGEEFNGLEGFNGSEEELGREWDRRMKTHLVNTHAYIKRNPKRVSAFYNVPALQGAYRELIGAWDSMATREGTLDRLSKIEESFLKPELQGLGDILGGDDDRLFGLINADLNEIMGLGDLGKRGRGRSGGGGGGRKTVFKRPASKKAAARKAAKASRKAFKKRGPFTKIKQANKKIKANVKKTAQKASAKVKAVAKKIGKLAVKGATWPILAGGLLAMKTNFARMASKMYWGMFPKEEALQVGILPEWWEASNKTWNYARNLWVNKLMGKEETLRKAIITGRGAKVAKRGTTAGLGSISELYTNGLSELMGYNGLGIGEAEASVITAFAALIVPIVTIMNQNMKGKKKTANSEPDAGDASTDTGAQDTGEEEVSQSEAANIEDNYNNEVVENQPEQEPEADGSVQEEEESVDGIGTVTFSEWIRGVDEEREYDPQFGDLGKKIKSKPNTKVAKRVKRDKIAKKAARKAKKAVKKQKRIDKIAAKRPKAAARKQKRLNRKAPAQKHIEDAEALKAMPKKNLIEKIKTGIAKIKAKKAAGQKISTKENALLNLTKQGVEMVADKIQNKSPEQIEQEANNLVPADATYSDSQGNQYENKEAYVKALAEKGITPEEDITKGGGPNPEEEETGRKDMTKSEGMSTGAKVGLSALALLGLALILKPKKKAAVNGLGSTEGTEGLGKFTKGKHHKNVYELRKDSEKVQKMLKNKGERLVHGYAVKNRKLDGAKKRVFKIK